MATHDYIISNASGASVRADLNNALAAIVSNNSNATSPATTYAYQWWADTTTGQLKLRNSANSAWITIFELDGTMLMEDGTLAAPGLAFASDLDTGFSRSAANKINFSTGGAERLEIGSSEVVFNDPSNDVDFRVESNGNANMLFVDAGNDAVGIGIGTPTSVLDVRDTQTGAASEIKLFNLDQGNTTTQTSALVMTPDVRANGAKIAVVKEIADFSSTANKDIAITFSPVVNNAAFEAARIDSSGNLGVGTSSPTGFIHIEGTSTGTETYGRFTTGPAAGDQSLVIKSSSTRDHMAIQVATNAGANDDLSLQPDGGNVGIGTTAPSNSLHINGSSPAIRLSDTGANGSAVSIIEDNNGLLKLRNDVGNAGTGSGISFEVNASEQCRVDESGRLLVGTSTSRIVEDHAGNGPTGRIQIEATNSDAIASIISAGTSDANRCGTLSLGRHRNSTVGGTPTVVQSGDSLGAICFAGGDGTDMRSKGAKIVAEVDGTPGSNDMPGRLIFSTTADGGVNPTERVRIDSSGNLGVGVTPDDWGGSRKAIQFDSAGAAYLCNDSSMGVVSNMYFDGSNDKYINAGSASAVYVQNDNVVFNFAGSGSADANASFVTRVRVDNDGLKFGSDTAAANALDDYEEGAWTPDFRNRTSAAPTIQEGQYRKIGSQIFAFFHISVSATLTSSATSLQLSGLPFPAKSGGQVYGALSTMHMNNSFTLANTEANFNGLVPPGTSYVDVYFNQGASSLQLPVSRFGTGNILGCVMYFVA